MSRTQRDILAINQMATAYPGIYHRLASRYTLGEVNNLRQRLRDYRAGTVPDVPALGALCQAMQDEIALSMLERGKLQ